MSTVHCKLLFASLYTFQRKEDPLFVFISKSLFSWVPNFFRISRLTRRVAIPFLLLFCFSSLNLIWCSGESPFSTSR
ncbi:unnamed protein product [Phytomonas sp. EM1]|nr:unnamed protein product [Phytomonas sp. EM1]|eukprot:CCW62578.1 unnamed protein product [Phytomonas sp. isolate EM1]